MSDPAVVAARQAWASRYPGWHDFNRSADSDGIAAGFTSAAREALNPIRQLHDDIWDLSHRNGFSESHQDGMRYVLHELAKLIFTSEELER